MIKNIFLFMAVVFLSGCLPTNSKLAIDIKKKSSRSLFKASVSSVQVINHQLVINGVGLSDVTQVVVNGHSLNENFSIESKTNSKITANSLHNFSFDVSKVFSLILSDAEASATFQIDFSLCQASLNGAGFDCSAPLADNDVLAYDSLSNTWIPKSLSGLSFRGVWDANTAFPAANLVGQYYIVNAANLPTYNVGDWIVWNGTSFDHIAQSTAGGVSTVFGRPGAVVAVEGDYNLDKLFDVDLTTPPTAGQVLKYDGTKWVADDEAGGTIAAGSITATELASNSVTDAKIVAVAASKISGSITSAQITDGAIVNADINAAAAIDYSKLNIPNTTIPYAKLNIANGEIPAAKISGLPAATAILTTSITDSDTTHAPDADSVFDALAGKLNTSGGTIVVGTINGIPNPTNNDDVSNKAYTDLRDALKLTKTGDTMSGILTLDNDLRVKGGSNYVTVRGNAASAAYTLTLPVDAGTSNQVLTTNGSGALSWSTPATTAAPTGTAGGDLSGTYPNPTISGLSAAKVGGGAVDNTEFSYLDGVTSAIQTQLNAKEGTLTAGTAAQYYKGNKTWATLDTDAVAEGSNLYFTIARAKSATVVDAIVDGILDVSPSQNAVFDALAGKLNLTGGTLSIGTISGVPTPTTDDQVVNKSYVDSSHTDGALIPASTVILMNSCAVGWTDLGAVIGGPSSSFCTTAAGLCRKCQSPASASRLPASTTMLLETCPASWTNLGATLGPGSAGKSEQFLFQMCQSPSASVGLSLGAKILMPTCPASWSDFGSTSAGGPFSADCGSGQCRICSAPGSVRARTLEGSDAAGVTSVGDGIAISAGAGGATSGNGGNVNITAGHTTVASTENSGNVNITAGSAGSGTTALTGNINLTAGLNPGVANKNGNITLNSGSTTVGTGGYVLLNPNNTTGLVGIGTSTPTKLLTVNGELEAQTVYAATLAATTGTVTTLSTSNFVVHGNMTGWVVSQMRNNADDGVSGTSYLDKTGATRGFTGFANGTSTYFPNSVFLSTADAVTPLVFGIQGIEAMKIGIDGGINMGAVAPPLTYRLTVANGGIDITSGGVRATGAYNQTSDIRLKTHIDYLNSQTALEKITSLRGIYYDWKDQEKMGADRQLGLIAQDVEKVFPQAVKTDSKGFLSVGYATLVAPIIEAIKELNKRVVSLFEVTDKHSRAIASINSNEDIKDQKIKKLEVENAEMKKRLEKIERSLNGKL